MQQTIPWRCDRTSRCKGSQGTCGCRWSMPCVPRQSGTRLSTCRPAWRRNAACRWCPPPTPHTHCSSCTASKSWAEEGRVINSVQSLGFKPRREKKNTSEWPPAFTYLDSLQVFPSPAVEYGRCAVLTPVDDVLVVSSKAHDVFVETEALYQRLSSCRRQPKVSVTPSISATHSVAQLCTSNAWGRTGNAVADLGARLSCAN